MCDIWNYWSRIHCLPRQTIKTIIERPIHIKNAHEIIYVFSCATSHHMQLQHFFPCFVQFCWLLVQRTEKSVQWQHILSCELCCFACSSLIAKMYKYFIHQRQNNKRKKKKKYQQQFCQLIGILIYPRNDKNWYNSAICLPYKNHRPFS